MSLLRISTVERPDQIIAVEHLLAAIAGKLKPHGVRFERWSASKSLAPDASNDEVLAAYAAQVDAIKATGYGTVDVARIAPNPADPEWPQKAQAARSKFLEEHTHAEDEVRFFVEGRGLFCLRLGDQIFQVLCEAGDLIWVPAKTRHWFDMGTEPRFCAIRFFQNPDGWVGTFTQDPIAKSFPTFDQLTR